MNKIFDLLGRWGEQIYQARRESLMRMYHFEEFSDKDTELNDLPRSPHNALKMKILTAENS
jgi:hypothetical protein